jgi:hypothetical protein
MMRIGAKVELDAGVSLFEVELFKEEIILCEAENTGPIHA